MPGIHPPESSDVSERGGSNLSRFLCTGGVLNAGEAGWESEHASVDDGVTIWRFDVAVLIVMIASEGKDAVGVAAVTAKLVTAEVVTANGVAVTASTVVVVSEGFTTDGVAASAADDLPSARGLGKKDASNCRTTAGLPKGSRGAATVAGLQAFGDENAPELLVVLPGCCPAAGRHGG